MALLTRKLVYGGMFALALLVGITAGCSEAPQKRAANNIHPDMEASKPLPPPETLNLNFLGANPPPSTDYVTQLDFELASFSGGSQPMMITDPKKPVSAKYTVGDYTLQVTPVLSQVKQSNSNRWLANGCYEVDFFDTTGKPVAKLKVDENGYLQSKSRGDLPGYQTKGYTSKRRALFVVSRKTTLETYPVLGVEFKENTAGTRYEFTDTDSSTYTFNFPDGKIMVFSPEAIGDLPEQLTASGEFERELREKQHKQHKKEKACKKLAASGG